MFNKEPMEIRLPRNQPKRKQSEPEMPNPARKMNRVYLGLAVLGVLALVVYDPEGGQQVSAQCGSYSYGPPVYYSSPRVYYYHSPPVRYYSTPQYCGPSYRVVPNTTRVYEAPKTTKTTPRPAPQPTAPVPTGPYGNEEKETPTPPAKVAPIPKSPAPEDRPPTETRGSGEDDPAPPTKIQPAVDPVPAEPVPSPEVDPFLEKETPSVPAPAPPEPASNENLPLIFRDFDVRFEGKVTSLKMIKVKMADGRVTTLPCINGMMPEYNLLKSGQIQVKYDYRIPFDNYQARYDKEGIIEYGERPPSENEVVRRTRWLASYQQ